MKINRHSILASPRAPRAQRSVRRLVCALLIPVLVCIGLPLAKADLRAPVWYDQNAVSLAPDWHYRVPINVPAGATVNSTIVVNVDFAAQLALLGVSGVFDANSPRVVRSTGALSTLQEFTDTVYLGATDAAGDGQGEVRFILQDAGAVTYYLYFDITGNGAKPANPQTPINGNFEVGASGTGTPVGWNAPTKSNATMDAQIRPSENPNINNIPAVADAPRVTDGTPNTGVSSYLIGQRTAAALLASNPGVTFTKTLTVPATTPGNMTVRWRPEGWDSSDNGATTWEFLRIDIVGATTTEFVGPAAGAYVTKPFSPNFGLNQTTAAISGYGQYNGYDCTTGGAHTAGMTVACKSEPWWTVNQSLAAWAGQTVTLRFRYYSSDDQYRAWFSIDDVEWSVVNATLGTAQAYGTNITLPAAATTFTGGQTLSIRAQVDASATAAGTPVTADIYDQVGTLATSGIVLYNDATHGDVTANDAIWSNNGSVLANPTYTVPGGVPSGTSWLLRVYARDTSTSTIGATNGLIHIPGQPNTPFSQANFYNVDEINFTVNTPFLTHLKTVAISSDPINGAVNPKNIPGGLVLYTINVTNSGSGAVDNNTVIITDPIPANTELFTGNLGGGAPFIFTNGAPTSGLACAFIALGNFTDCVDFSNNGGATWVYVPNGTYDPAVTNIRFSPTGAMNADGVVGPPSPNASVVFQVRIK